MPKFQIETVSIFKVVYTIDAESEEHALDEVAYHTTGGPFDEKWTETYQNHIAENIVSAREISETEFLADFDKNNPALVGWIAEQKLSLVNKIDYESLKK